MSEANSIAVACRNITLYKLLKICYNIIESKVLLWQNRNTAKCQWISPLILLTLSNKM